MPKGRKEHFSLNATPTKLMESLLILPIEEDNFDSKISHISKTSERTPHERPYPDSFQDYFQTPPRKTIFHQQDFFSPSPTCIYRRCLTRDKSVSLNRNAPQLEPLFAFERASPDPISPPPKRSVLETPSQEKTDLELFQTSAKSNSSNRDKERGMRVLSQKILQEVRDGRCNTYEDVALKLIEELSQTAQSTLTKDQKNLKRRAYDILNVMLSVGVLIKDGKRISTDFQFKRQKETVSMMRRELILKETVLAEKRKMLQIAEERRRCLQELTRVNQSIPKSKTLIEFPFVGITINRDQKVRLSTKGVNFFAIDSDTQLTVRGDSDLLMLIRSSSLKL